MTDAKLRVGVAGAGHFGRYHALKVAASSRTGCPGFMTRTWSAPRPLGGKPAPRKWISRLCWRRRDALIVAAPARGPSRPGVAGACGRASTCWWKNRSPPRWRRRMSWGRWRGKRGLVLQVGHLERFSAAYQAMAGRIGAPLYIEATRIAPFKLRGTDVSVILDLMIHDLDLVLALVDSEIESVDAVGAPVASPHEDIANARLQIPQRRRGYDHCQPDFAADRAADADLRAERLYGRGFRGSDADGDLANTERGWRLAAGPAAGAGRRRVRHRGCVVGGT